MKRSLIISIFYLSVICFLTTLSSKVIGQTNPYVPSIVPPSPNAAALMKFSDIPVSQYSGSADVTIPIYEIKAKGISVPISLSYHTSGIKVKEEAGWVGLGWALNAGGSISRTIMDKDDWDGTNYYNSVVPEINCNLSSHSNIVGDMGPYGYDFFCNYLVNTVQGNKDYSGVFLSQNPFYDLEPDIYSYSFLGHSGKFIIGRDRKIIIQKQENLKIQVDNSALTFTITDDQGNRFFFSDKELVQNNNGLPSSGSTSSWYLSKIISQQNDTVKFNYQTDNTWTSIDGDISQSYRTACPPVEGLTSIQSPATLYWNITLQSIDFASGQLQFSFDNSRVDLQSGKKLNSVKLYSKSNAGLNYIKENQFYYSYFNSTYGGIATEFKRLRLDSVKEVSGSLSLPAYSFVYTDPPNNVALSGKHSFSADHWGYFNGVSNSMFVPSFNGVYNAPGVNPNQGQYLQLSGANREPDSSYMKTFSLQQVNYPTGGKTVFQFEPNYYDEDSSRTTGPPDFPQYNLVDTTATIVINTHGQANGTIDLTKIYPTTLNTPNITLTVTFRATTNNGCSVYRNTQGKIYFTFYGITTDISNTNLTCDPNTPVCTVTLPIAISTATVLPWTGYIDPTIGSDFVEIRVTAHWQELRSLHYNNPTVMCSGLRIKSITDYTATSTIAKTRSYDYAYQQDRNTDGTNETYSFGKLMSYPSYARYEVVLVASGGTTVNCNSLTRYSGSNTAISSVITGNIVGYSQVTEYNVDYTNGLNNGKTVYRFFNSPDTVYYFSGWRLPGVLNMGNNLDGNLASKTVYSNQGTYYKKISSSSYNYHTVNRLVYYNMKYTFLAPPGGMAGGCSPYCGNPCGGSVQFEFQGAFYPSVKSERILLDSVTETTYDQADTLKFLTTVKRSYYDNPIHYQLTRSNIIDSKGNKHTTLIKYPQDYIPNGFTVTGNTVLDSLINRNMVSKPIESRDSLYYYGSSTGYISGAKLSRYRILSLNSVGLDKQFKLDIQSPVTDLQPFAINGNTISQDSRYRQMISFDSYTTPNDIQQFTSTDQNPVSIIWDYRNTYPIAQVKNAAITDVAYTSFEDDGKGNWTISDTTRLNEGITGNKSFVLNSINNLAFTSANTGSNYILSYWSKDGQVTIAGATAVSTNTGLTKNGWTYYEHTVTKTSSTITLTASAIRTIDELRLYPVTSKMTTYTYSTLVGITNQCSPNNIIIYYNYDSFNRLRFIRDIDGNIIKTFEYNYKH